MRILITTISMMVSLTISSIISISSAYAQLTPSPVSGLKPISCKPLDDDRSDDRCAFDLNCSLSIIRGTGSILKESSRCRIVIHAGRWDNALFATMKKPQGLYDLHSIVALDFLERLDGKTNLPSKAVMSFENPKDAYLSLQPNTEKHWPHLSHGHGGYLKIGNVARTGDCYKTVKSEGILSERDYSAEFCFSKPAPGGEPINSGK